MSEENSGEQRPSTPVSDRAFPSDLTIVSNREPYEHSYDDGDITVSKPTGGLTTSLVGVLQATGGTWVAWGSGEADFDPDVVTNGTDYRPVDEQPECLVRRLDLSETEVHEYYYGYSNQVLWPLCHFETEHIVYDRSTWQTYKKVNERFANVLETVQSSLVWIQDYHLALLPREIRERGGTDRTLVQFWHIPWPPLELFEICPDRDELLDGLLANDAIGFHTERYRERFLECVDALVPRSTIETDTGVIQYRGRQIVTYASPIGIDTRAPQNSTTSPEDDTRWITRDVPDIDRSNTLAVGVDRLDYTKGIVEKLEALEDVWATHPDLRGHLTYVQKVSKSRERIPSYRKYHQRVLEKVEEINERFRTPEWRPIIYIDQSFDRDAVTSLFASADIGVVSSRRDGLNLVSEELVFASQSDPAVLLLSEFAGVAEILDEGPVTINPFDTQHFSRAIVRAVEMDTDERVRRHEQMIRRIERHSLDAWLETHAELFETLRE